MNEVRVKTVLEGIYQEHGRNKDHRGTKSDPDSINTIETLSWRKAYRSLGSSDRNTLDKAIKTFSGKTGMKQDAILCVLVRLGIYLNACEDGK